MKTSPYLLIAKYSHLYHSWTFYLCLIPLREICTHGRGTDTAFYRPLRNCKLSALMAPWQFLPPFIEKMGERSHLPFYWNWRFLKETGWKLCTAPWDEPFFGNPMHAYRGNARAVRSSLPYWQGSLGEGASVDRQSHFLSWHSEPLAVKWSMALGAN